MSDTAAPARRELRSGEPVVAPAARARARWWNILHPGPARLNLALQGGGAHGAFTWGVLDALLEDPRTQFEGLSGSSAGAMNAAMVADGWLKGGRDGARETLRAFWTSVGQHVPAGMVVHGEGDAISLSPASKWMARWAGYFSPSQLNPFELNPLRALLESRVDFERLRVASPFKLFVGATHVGSGRLRLFREHELTVDMLLASACLPKLHHPVEIEGQSYWDGGFAANPAVYPLFYDCDARDVMLVLLGPLTRDTTPRTVDEIDARITEIAFSAPFMREMRMFTNATAFARTTFLTRGRLERRLHRMRFHMIDSSELPSMQRAETRALAHGPYLERLFSQGRDSASAWLAQHGASIGRRSTVELDRYFG